MDKTGNIKKEVRKGNENQCVPDKQMLDHQSQLILFSVHFRFSFLIFKVGTGENRNCSQDSGSYNMKMKERKQRLKMRSQNSLAPTIKNTNERILNQKEREILVNSWNK